MQCLQLKILSLSAAVAMLGWAQGTDQAPGPQEPLPAYTANRSFPFELAGYVNFRYVNDDAMQIGAFSREYSASVFLSKTVGRWRFHSEFNANTLPEYDSDGIHLFPRRPSLSVKLDSGFVNYNARDWLQVQGGFLFVPTYWRTHRYQSTTLTVDEPLMDQNVFPTAVMGGALYGDKYWGDGGVSYMAYGGIDRQSHFSEKGQVFETKQSQVIGGKLIFHMPSRQFFRTFDVAVHRLHRTDTNGFPDEMYGIELQLNKNRFEVLGEFAHTSLRVVNGVRRNFRQGYYLQPSYRIKPRLFAVARYDRLNRDSLYADQSSLVRQSVGLIHRPIPAVSLKIEGDRYEPEGGRLPAYFGATVSVVWFFHLP